MSKIATWFASLVTNFAAFWAKLAKACNLTSSVPNVMDREEADQTHSRLQAMQKHSEEASSHEKHFDSSRTGPSHTELDSVNSDHWFEKNNQPYSDSQIGASKKIITKNRLMSQSKMTHTRLNAYIDTIKKDTDNDIDRDAHADSES